MFSPAGRRTKPRDRDGGGASAKPPSASTPFKPTSFFPLPPAPVENEGDVFPSSPSTPMHRLRLTSPGKAAAPSPSPSSIRLSNTIVRSPSLLNSTDKSRDDTSRPVFVSDFPQELRNAVRDDISAPRTDASRVCGGMDPDTGLSWMIHGIKIFVWSHVRTKSAESFRTLYIPASLCNSDYSNIDPKHGDRWIVCIVKQQEETELGNSKFSEKCSAASLLMCNQRSLAMIYWPNVFSEQDITPLVSFNLEDKPSIIGSMVASSYKIGDVQYCVCIACQSSGELWRFDCSSTNISRERIVRSVNVNSSQSEVSQSFAKYCAGGKSLAWVHNEGVGKEGFKIAFLLTAFGLECWNVEIDSGRHVSLEWTFDLLADLDESKILVGQKQVWLLDFQVNVGKRRLKLLLASHSMDKINNSSYMQYCVANYSYDLNSAQREGDIHVILPKARIEEEEFLYSMRLRVGGKPEGSVMILASDGTATIAHDIGGMSRLYQFDLAWDVGKVVDACVLSSSEDNEEGSWLVLTEKAGVWAIPTKAVLLCGIEPPERSLLRKGSPNEGIRKEDRHRRENLETTGFTSLNEAQQTLPLHDEEAEALVGQLFQEYLSCGQVDFVFEKLQQAGAFEREGNGNVFALASKALVDTLAKHWTSSMVTNMALMAAVSSQLAEKQHRHQQFLHFLLASKSLEELKQRQRSALHNILEHGEKLSAMVWLREMHNTAVKARLQTDMQSSEPGGGLWDLVQLTGEKARRSNVMLLDRDKAEVFYSRVSDLEDLFSCVHLHIELIVSRDQPLHTQVDKICEISYACTKALQTAMHYRDAQQTWYPSPEGLTPWYCKSNVRLGLWKLCTLILDLKDEASGSASSLVEKLVGNLEGLVDILLESYAGAITAKVEREEEYRGLQKEYWSKRDTLLNSMYQYAKAVAEAATESFSHADAEERKLDAIKKLYPPLVSLARRHAGYQTLWDICTELNDINCLRSLMHESMGLKEGRFSNFVFEQCYKNRQYSKLLRLGEEFKEELLLFLQNHKDLLWLHELYMRQFTLASSTLHWLALSKEAGAQVTVDSIQGHLKPSCKVGKMTLGYRKRLLNLAKLSALAGGERVSGIKTLGINADLEMITIQAEAYNLGMIEEDDVLTPKQLVEVCLSSEKKELILRAFDVFAWGGDVFRRCNKSLLESAWLKAASQDDWVMMRQVSERDGWSDDQYLEALQNTALYLASNRCYGEGSECVGGTFEELLPLLYEEREQELDFTGKEMEMPSVETTLMQHPDYVDAGEAMLAALRMGKCLVEVFEKDSNDVMEV